MGLMIYLVVASESSSRLLKKRGKRRHLLTMTMHIESRPLLGRALAETDVQVDLDFLVFHLVNS